MNGSIPRIADIDAIPSPVLWPLVLGCAGLLLTCIVVGIRWRLALKGRTTIEIATHDAPLTMFDELERSWRSGMIDDHVLAYELAALLRHHYGLARLDEHPPADCPLAAKDWRALVGTLSALRYDRTTQRCMDARCSTLIRTCLLPAHRNESCRA